MSKCPYCCERTAVDVASIRRHIYFDCWVVRATERERNARAAADETQETPK